jgi:FAD/FMN-containing dehydrogenase
MVTEAASVGDLRPRLTGGVVGPDDSRWTAARGAYNLTVDQRPAAVACPADADDVATAVRFAAERGLQVSAQRTGHNAGALATAALDDTLLVSTAALDEVSVAADARRARVGGGVTWEIDPRAFYPADTYQRLRTLKARLDPHERVLANHPIPPAT